jgi:hypothetical protein
MRLVASCNGSAQGDSRQVATDQLSLNEQSDCRGAPRDRDRWGGALGVWVVSHLWPVALLVALLPYAALLVCVFIVRRTGDTRGLRDFAVVIRALTRRRDDPP